jgi:hypothetical protein
MSKPPRPPFAYGPLGQVLVATDGAWVCVSPAQGEGPLWSFQAAAPVAGVRSTRTGIFVVDAKGVLARLAIADGKPLGQVDCDVKALGLTATVDGLWGVCHPDGVCVGEGIKLPRRQSINATTCAALDETGKWLAVGTHEGDVHVIGLEASKRYRLPLGAAITGVAFSRLRGWFVCTAEKVVRVDLDLGRHEVLTESENALSGCVASPDGLLCAFRLGRHQVTIIGPEGGEVGFVYYPKQIVGEIEFGPFPWLGVGIGFGAGNRISLLEEDLIYCTEVPPGRPEISWQVGSEVAGDKILAEREKLRSQGLLPKQDEAVMDAVAAGDESEEDWDDELEDDEDHEEDEWEPEHAAHAPPPPTTSLPRARVPFVLDLHERVLVSGGFGGKLPWSWTISLGIGCVTLLPVIARDALVALSRGRLLPGLIFLGMGLVLLFLTALPFLCSGRYWLTNLRLCWKPRLRAMISVPLRAIDVERLSVWDATSSLRIRGEMPVSLHCVGNLDRLWGGLMLFAKLEEFEPAEMEGGTQAVAWWPAQCVDSLSKQQGIAVLRPEYFAFLPVGEKVNVVGKVAGFAVRELADKVLGIEPDERLEKKLPMDLLLEVLHERHPLELDACVHQAADQHDGIVWGPEDAEVLKEALPLQPSRCLLLFAKKRRVVRGLPSREQEPYVEYILQRWSEGGPIRIREPIGRLARLALMFTVPALLFAWGGAVMGADPKKEPWESWLAYSFAATLGLLGLFSWILTITATFRALRRRSR